MSVSSLQYYIILWILISLTELRTDAGSTADILTQERKTARQKLRHKGLIQKRSRDNGKNRCREEPGDDTKYTSDEARLISVLLSRYKSHKTLARPVLNSNHTITVYFGLDLQQILDFDEKDQVLQTRMWKEYRWLDELLTWDPQDFNGVSDVRLLRKNVWVPDIILYNNVDSSESEEHNEMMLVSSHGNMTWIPPVIYKSSCQVDMTEYPFDEQSCSLRFGSWSYDTKRLDLHFMEGFVGMKTNRYLPNSEWEIVENTATRNLIKYDCCPYPYGDLTFNLTLRRKVSFQLRLMLLPTLLLSTISLFMFWIPAHRPDRTALGMSLFSSFFLLLILIVSNSPPSPKAKIGLFFCVIIMLVTIGIMLSVFIINISQSVRPMPAFVDAIVVGRLGRIMCPGESKSWKNKDRNVTLESNASGSLLNSAKENGHANSQTNNIQGVVQNDPEENKRKWRIFGEVLDRFFFLVYFSTLIFAFIFVFPKPHMIMQIL